MTEDLLTKLDRLSKLKLPDITLSLKEMIDIIAQGYKIETTPFYGNTDNNTELLGLHIDDGKNLEILINSEQSKEEKNLTIIHECYHSLCRKYNITQDEDIVNALALKTYKKLYGEPTFMGDYYENRKKR
jgi:Zn-dependent peptidase ImmA (M78 family)